MVMIGKEMRLIIVRVGIVMLLMTIMPSPVNSASQKDEPVCWQKMYECVSSAMMLTHVPSFDSCCPEIKTQIADDLPCFCSTGDVIVNTSLEDCKLGSNFDKMCKGVSKSESGNGNGSGSGSNSHEVGKPPGMVQNGATSIGLLLGLVSASATLFAWMMIIF